MPPVLGPVARKFYPDADSITVPYFAHLHRFLQHDLSKYEKTSQDKSQANIPLWYSTVQYSTVQYSTVQYSTVQYSTVQYSTVQYSTV